MMTITADILRTAFRKLLSAVYYDKTDMVMRYHVAEFVKILSSKEKEREIFDKLLSVVKGENNKQLDLWLQDMSLSLYPKKVTSISDEEIIDEHIITNIPPKQMSVERLMVKAKIPVELCILDVAWLMLYGFKVDSKLYKHSYGNRMDLISNGGGVRSGNALFRKYQSQYKEWWKNGIKVANQHLKNNEKVTIINFDISNCYHSIDFDFEKFFVYYDKNWHDDNLREDALTKIIIKVYQRYWEITKNSDIEVFNGKNKEKCPMPLTLMSAHVLANWYLSPLDDFINKKYTPYYYGRYVDDCMVVVETQSEKCITLEDCFQKDLPELMSFDGDMIVFDFAKNANDENIRLQTFELQQDKLYVYRFCDSISQPSLEEFEQEQKERSSEFRFLTDDADTGNVNLDFVSLINAFDVEEEPGRRFNILEENKYKLAVYLAKLSSRLSKYGEKNKHYNEEVEKIHHFFTEGYLIKHYQLWERLMTVFVLAGKQDYVEELVKNAKLQIKKLKPKTGLFGNIKSGKKLLVDSLMFHLEQSKNMALSLHRENLEIDTLYLDTFMVRMHYNLLPLQEFSEKFATNGVKQTMNGLILRKELFKYRWMPYYVKYYAIVNALSIGEVYNPNVYREAFAIYCKLNHVGNVDDWRAFCRPPQNGNVNVTEFNVDLATNPVYDKNVRTVSVVEMDIKKEDVENVIDEFGKVYPEKVDVFENILDQITKIKNTDIFILPELSLPIYELMSYCRYSAKHEIAFVSGMEYVVKNKIVYNYIITCLPITLYGQKDAVPVIRLKNYYAPDEKQDINKKDFFIPEEIKNIDEKGRSVPLIIWQNLYHWHGHIFTSYYCFELASIKERSFFYSMIDAMYCPVFNKDTYYFNNIAESMARDMHCYFILCNVSHYGDSRVTKPAKHEEMNMLKVKGGNTVNNRAVVLSAELDVDRLRKFQKMSESEQEANKKVFKKTPPDYDKNMVEKRERIEERFLFPYKEEKDRNLAESAEKNMKY